MPIITSIEMIQKLKTKDKVDFICDFCNKQFQRTKGEGYFKQYGFENRKFYCNNQCQLLARLSKKPKHTVECKQCGVKFQAQYADSNRKFCSQSCAAIFTNPHKISKPKIVKTCLNCSKQTEYLPGKLTTKTGKFCSSKCCGEYTHTNIKQQIKQGTYSSIPSRPLIYKMLCEDYGNKCSICNIPGDNWNGKPIRLWVDHIDGYANNNAYSNFRLICPNCDSQLDTCRAKNKGKGRKSLGLPVG